jgi:hypothetical protein
MLNKFRIKSISLQSKLIYGLEQLNAQCFSYQRKPKYSMMSDPPPPNYTCNRCNRTGHWVKNCPLVTTFLTSLLLAANDFGWRRSFLAHLRSQIFHNCCNKNAQVCWAHFWSSVGHCFIVNLCLIYIGRDRLFWWWMISINENKYLRISNKMCLALR